MDIRMAVKPMASRAARAWATAEKKYLFVFSSALNSCVSLEEALNNLDSDRDFLISGDVFSNDMIDAYINLKMEEVMRSRMATHPIEFDMYYSL